MLTLLGDMLLNGPYAIITCEPYDAAENMPEVRSRTVAHQLRRNELIKMPVIIQGLSVFRGPASVC